MGFLCAIGSAVLYGLLPLLAKMFYTQGGNAWMLVSARFLLAIPILYLLIRLRQKTIWIEKRQLITAIILAQGYMLTNLLLSFSYSYIPAGMSTTLHFLYPTIVLIACARIYKEKISKSKTICAVLGLIGIICFYTPGPSVSMVGVTFALCSSITFAFYVIYDEQSGSSLWDPTILCFWISLVSGLEALTATLISNSIQYTLSYKAWGIAFIVSSGCTILPIILAQIGIRKIGAEKTSFLSTFEPLTSVICGILFLHEMLTFQTAIGSICILSAAAILGISENKS